MQSTYMLTYSLLIVFLLLSLGCLYLLSVCQSWLSRPHPVCLYAFLEAIAMYRVVQKNGTKLMTP